MSIYATIELDKFGHQDLPRELDPEVEGLVYGQNLGQCDGWDELDAIATAAGVRPISSFLFSSEMLAEFELDEVDLPPEVENWAPISEGIKTLETLVSSLEKQSQNERVGRYSAQDVLWDLCACLAILKRSKPPNEQFRIDVC